MNRMQEWLARAAKELGLRVEIGRIVILASGRPVVSQALFPDLSCPLGNLVFRSDETPDASTRRELSERGFGISTFSEPRAEGVFDLDSYAEMFAEWGWTGNAAAKPTWMDDPRWAKSDGDD